MVPQKRSYSNETMNPSVVTVTDECEVLDSVVADSFSIY